MFNTYNMESFRPPFHSVPSDWWSLWDIQLNWWNTMFKAVSSSGNYIRCNA